LAATASECGLNHFSGRGTRRQAGALYQEPGVGASSLKLILRGADIGWIDIIFVVEGGGQVVNCSYPFDHVGVARNAKKFSCVGNSEKCSNREEVGGNG